MLYKHVIDEITFLESEIEISPNILLPKLFDLIKGKQMI